MRLDVRYLCWGCGSEIIVYEESNDKLVTGEIEKWNLCPLCVKK